MSNDAIIQGVGLKEVLREQVQAALAQQALAAAEMTEFYLVNLLAEFHASGKADQVDDDLLARPLALLMLEAAEGGPVRRAQCLRRLGDTALVLTAFYAERIRRTIMGLSYYVAMGGQAYGKLAAISGEPLFAKLYRELSIRFADYAEALSIVAPWNHAISDGDLVKIYERWLATGDEKLEALLEEGGISTEDARAS